MSNEVKTEVKEAKKEVKIDPAYQGYVFLGWASGLFELKNGEKRPYHNMYVFSPSATMYPTNTRPAASRRRKRSASARTYGRA
ncbi:hypothetical protein [uncultured Oscillibacter sp.]|uniref:hypothetical protein n=1 Tax=uncultured Oscillibacter sp. TaxID=876091 RepID=UPI002624F826|nr:hypothetical protein [uncultured Oscillibacter sp.]